MKNLFIVLIAVLSFAACSSSDTPEWSDNDTHRIEIEPMQKTVIMKGNQFAYKAWENVCELNDNNNGNQFFSPLSLQFALSLLANGADGEALDEIVALYSEGNGEEGLANLNSLNKKLLNELPIVDKSIKICFANSIWCDRSLDFRDDYISRCKAFYDASTNKYDTFTEQGRQDINRWCAENTGGMIKEFLKNPPKYDVMLANASYFKGHWKHPFDVKNTREDDFFCASGETKKVSMMTSDGYPFYGYENAKMAYVELSYRNKGFYMNIMMPKEGADFNECVKTLCENGIDWNSIGEVKLTVPKFEIDASYNLLDMVSNLGVPHIANAFTKILVGNDFFVKELLQTSKIKVDEQGTEAAAVTGVFGETTSPGKPTYFEITLNRPFFFTITEQSTGAILFMGKVAQF